MYFIFRLTPFLSVLIFKRIRNECLYELQQKRITNLHSLTKRKQYLLSLATRVAWFLSEHPLTIDWEKTQNEYYNKRSIFCPRTDQMERRVDKDPFLSSNLFTLIELYGWILWSIVARLLVRPSTTTIFRKIFHLVFQNDSSLQDRLKSCLILCSTVRHMKEGYDSNVFLTFQPLFFPACLSILE